MGRKVVFQQSLMDVRVKEWREVYSLMFLQSIFLCIVRETDPKLLLWIFMGFGVMFYFSSVTRYIKANQMFSP